MADKEFTISDVLEPIGVGLNIPPFLGFRSQQTPSEVIHSRNHQASANSRRKSYKQSKELPHF